MLNHQRLLEKLFTSFITILTSIIAAEAVMSDPILIDPSKEYQETDYIINGGGVKPMTFVLTTRFLDILYFLRLLARD